MKPRGEWGVQWRIMTSMKYGAVILAAVLAGGGLGESWAAQPGKPDALHDALTVRTDDQIALLPLSAKKAVLDPAGRLWLQRHRWPTPAVQEMLAKQFHAAGDVREGYAPILFGPGRWVWVHERHTLYGYNGTRTVSRAVEFPGPDDAIAVGAYALFSRGRSVLVFDAARGKWSSHTVVADVKWKNPRLRFRGDRAGGADKQAASGNVVVYPSYVLRSPRDKPVKSVWLFSADAGAWREVPCGYGSQFAAWPHRTDRYHVVFRPERLVAWCDDFAFQVTLPLGTGPATPPVDPVRQRVLALVGQL
ncbi:hypothetical protein LCGC14_2518940, partial [marine sediment metagenome]